MTADLFISYAWTSEDHREWVRLLAAHVKAIGYDLLVDADVDYGDDLSGFMRRATDCRHALLIVDENYVDRADNHPESGVAIENGWIRDVYNDRPSTWLSVVFKDNPERSIPAWFGERLPKGLSFNANPNRNDFPGSEQVEELWRWIEELPANRDHVVTAKVLRERARRLEVIDRQRDPSSWRSPKLQDEILFHYAQSVDKTFTVGLGELTFGFNVSDKGTGAVYVYPDPIHAVGINRADASSHTELHAQLSPGRDVTAHVGEQVILQNAHGALCLVDVLEVQPEATSPEYVAPFVRFTYRILHDS